MVRLVGFEPTTSGATNQRSNQLSYNRLKKYLSSVCVTYGRSREFASPLKRILHFFVKIQQPHDKRSARFAQFST